LDVVRDIEISHDDVIALYQDQIPYGYNIPVKHKVVLSDYEIDWFAVHGVGGVNILVDVLLFHREHTKVIGVVRNGVVSHDGVGRSIQKDSEGVVGTHTVGKLGVITGEINMDAELTVVRGHAVGHDVRKGATEIDAGVLIANARTINELIVVGIVKIDAVPLVPRTRAVDELIVF
jgi:hypothetical protein